ncbi:PAS fold family [Synechococcus sp. PCC 7335]|uniref:ATP-binding protein n=1 Tax=Synechococcus sp. (strain ATCC 29403 / PCC 7335) TaxID=91464 RepID=UPI00017EBC21|nr:ATP-binding protein [Synechococcus sp. PCC 7335]EDX86013.1 PAS fold family [Synechococcus sp. PCC 7335]
MSARPPALLSSGDTTSSVVPPEVTLTICDREPIRIPGQIQPYGLLLVLADKTLEILQVSKNVRSFLGLEPAELLGQPLSRIAEEQQCQSIRQTIQALQTSNQPSGRSAPISLDSVILSGTARQTDVVEAPVSSWRGLLHVSADSIILELVPDATAASAKQPENIFTKLHQKVSQFQLADGLTALTNQIVQAVAELTGFDRVMVYQFATDYSGTVIAEVMAPSLEASSFFGLRYPATDIPAQARDLYLKNWSRTIPDVGYEPVGIVPDLHPLTHSPLDLGAAELRSVSPMHLEYLQNMGVRASMSISLIVENRLWGLIACHHSQPRSVSLDIRNACEFLGQIASLELFRQQIRTEKRYLAEVRSIQQQIRQTLMRSHPTYAIDSVLKQHQQALLALVHATGAAIVFDEHLTLIGDTPAAESVHALATWLVQKRQDVYCTHSLVQEFTLPESEQNRACGLLSISIFLSQSSYHVLWFRPELVQLVEWAGNPSKSTTVGEDGSLYLSPRQSFERWKESIHNQSLPWQSNEVVAAHELHSTLLLAALEFSQASLKRVASEANTANRAKSQFLAKMSHELRTPLNAILGFTQLLHYHETLSFEQRDRLNIINRSGEHLLSLINDVLETSRIEAGQLRLNESCFDLHQFIESIREMLTLRASNKNLLLKVNQTPRVPQYVWGDEIKLRQVIINLVGNAIKFTNNGEVRIRVSCLSGMGKAPIAKLTEEQEEVLTEEVLTNEIEGVSITEKVSNTACIQFEVSDTGCGIKSENFDAIFEPFKQTKAGRRAYEGTGLGLSISRQNARLMGGDIEVHSQLGEGSTFVCHVQLGLRTANDLTAPKQPLRRVVALAAGQRDYRILVVEDVAENRQLLISLLTTICFEVCTANDGKEAVDLWRQWHPDCILMDLYMPRMDGYAATQQIRAEQAAIELTFPPAIIALSASVIDHFRSDLVSFGFDDYVSKPFQINVILEKIAEHTGALYEYADDNSSDIDTDTSPKMVLPIEPEQIAALRSQLLAQPEAWQVDFHHAVLGAREHKIEQLIEQLSAKNVADSLRTCLGQLRFDLLQQLIEPLSG